MQLKCESTPVEQVCGSDGLTHANECYLNVTACVTKQKITVAYIGPCLENEYGDGKKEINFGLC